MEAPSLTRRLVAILAADVEGYSRLMSLDEEAALATLSAHRAAVDELIVAFRGRIANTAGDSVLAEFASVVDTVRCAVRIQKTIEDLNATLPEEQRMSFRIGINVGDVIAKDGDIFGDGVNIAARLQMLADAGGICVSRGRPRPYPAPRLVSVRRSWRAAGQEHCPAGAGLSGDR